ncbi:MAG: hypothetical protein JWL59_4662 [Chthoniobacteraceae bacterium]|nr:hypothetical protein [Chthoniobacteraceae bacterium]
MNINTNLSGTVRDAFLEILSETLLLIRSAASDQDLFHALADHAHNIPGHLRHYKSDLLIFYWETERPCFLHNPASRRIGQAFQDAWPILELEYYRIKTLP